MKEEKNSDEEKEKIREREVKEEERNSDKKEEKIRARKR